MMNSLLFRRSRSLLIWLLSGFFCGIGVAQAAGLADSGPAIRECRRLLARAAAAETEEARVLLQASNVEVAEKEPYPVLRAELLELARKDPEPFRKLLNDMGEDVHVRLMSGIILEILEDGETIRSYQDEPWLLHAVGRGNSGRLSSARSLGRIMAIRCVETPMVVLEQFWKGSPSLMPEAEHEGTSPSSGRRVESKYRARTRAVAACALGYLRFDMARPLLLESLRRPTSFFDSRLTRETAIFALARIGGEESFQGILTWLLESSTEDKIPGYTWYVLRTRATAETLPLIVAARDRAKERGLWEASCGRSLAEHLDWCITGVRDRLRKESREAAP